MWNLAFARRPGRSFEKRYFLRSLAAQVSGSNLSYAGFTGHEREARVVGASYADDPNRGRYEILGIFLEFFVLLHMGRGKLHRLGFARLISAVGRE